jgi:hypothetical protein
MSLQFDLLDLDHTSVCSDLGDLGLNDPNAGVSLADICGLTATPESI